MYCLNCGTKINDDELQCPHCGSSVAEMKERIAKAKEMVTYTDAVNPTVTSKLPLVAERTYKDKDGNPLDPSKEIEVDPTKASEDDLRAIPDMSGDDPYMTKPMPRIVSDSGKVVAEGDAEAKSYLQDVPEIKTWHRVVAILIALFLMACFLFVNAHTGLAFFKNFLGIDILALFG